MAAKRDALADDLNALASDFKRLLETVVHDPKEQARKERRWRLLVTVTGVVFTLGARRAAAKTWSLLTGEVPPGPASRPGAGGGMGPEEPEPTAARHEDEPAPAARS